MEPHSFCFSYGSSAQLLLLQPHVLLQIARAELPDWVLTTFLSNCMQDTNACQVCGGGRGAAAAQPLGSVGSVCAISAAL